MKTILVTGANRGLGLETCKQLVNLGHRVILTSRKDAQELADALGCDYHTLDVTNEQSIQTLKEYVTQKYGKIDALVNNAGILIDFHDNPLEVTLEKLRTTLEVNTLGALRMIQVFYPLVNERIVNVSSGMGQLQQMGSMCAAYRISKTALNAVTKIYSHIGSVKVNAICPGWVRTDMGGAQASLSVEQGVQTILWAALEVNESGNFYREKKKIPW